MTCTPALQIIIYCTNSVNKKQPIKQTSNSDNIFTLRCTFFSVLFIDNTFVCLLRREFQFQKLTHSINTPGLFINPVFCYSTALRITVWQYYLNIKKNLYF